MDKHDSAVVAGLAGGLGNQMFQYAAARALSLRLGVPLKLDLSWFSGRVDRTYALSNFHLSSFIETTPSILPPFIRSIEARLSRRFLSYRMGVSIYRERHYHFDAALKNIDQPVYLDGYWQSELYFAEYAEQIRADFSLLEPFSLARQAVADKFCGHRTVSVHVRRTDYVSSPTANAFHGTCSPQWYERAMEQLGDALSDVKFIVFTDDLEWAQDNLPKTWPCKFIGPSSDGRDQEDMHLMALCDHHIIANSSYSWWGAWLNRSATKQVLAPARWFASSKHNTQDLLPNSWLKI